MTIEKKFIKNRAFKNLMAHVCANSLTLLPGAVGVASLIGFQNTEGFLGFSLFMLMFLSAAAQVGTLILKFGEDDGKDKLENPFVSQFWKNKSINQEVKAKKEEVSRMMLAIRDLSIESECKNLTQDHYEQIGNLLVDKALYNLTFHSWIKSHGALARSGDEMQDATGLRDFYSEIDQITSRMDKKRLKDAERRAFDEKVKTLPEGYLLQLGLASVVGTCTENNNQTSELNSAIYGHYNYLFKQKFIQGFEKSDYQNFARIIRESQNSPNFAIKPLINFLKTNNTQVNWVELISIFKHNFKGDVDIYRELLKDLNEQKEKFRSAYEERQLQLEALQLVNDSSQRVSHVVNAEVNGNVVNQKPEDSAPTGQSSTKNLKEVEKEKIPLAHCPYVAHQGYLYSDKWADLKTNYDTMMAHATQIDAQTLNQMNRMLDASLPLLVKSDVNLKEFPLLHPESTKKLLSENLDLAIYQIKTVNQTIAADLAKELQITKNYQIMKMSG